MFRIVHRVTVNKLDAGSRKKVQGSIRVHIGASDFVKMPLRTIRPICAGLHIAPAGRRTPAGLDTAGSRRRRIQPPATFRPATKIDFTYHNTIDRLMQAISWPISFGRIQTLSYIGWASLSKTRAQPCPHEPDSVSNTYRLAAPKSLRFPFFWLDERHVSRQLSRILAMLLKPRGVGRSCAEYCVRIVSPNPEKVLSN